MLLNTIPDNNTAELRAFDDVCARLSGFNAEISYEWVDGFMTALNAGPRLPPVDAWLPALCGDAFDRAFGDPTAHAAALRALKARMAVLRQQLDPELLLDNPEDMRLNPLMSEWTDAERARVVDEQGITAEQALQMQTGALWADGFMEAVDHFSALWPDPGVDDELSEMYQALWHQIDALGLLPGSAEMQAHQDTYFPAAPPSRDDLVAEAMYAVQDLRVYWVNHAPRPETRRVEKASGRNDPCPCGSGRKFKKCHGQA